MTEHDTWVVVNTRHDSAALAQHNSVFTISNGYLGLRGNLQECHHGPLPLTIIAGVFDELDMFSLIRASTQERRYLDPAYFDSAGKSPAVANLPDPLHVRVFVADHEISLTQGTVTQFRQWLDLRTGLYSYRYDYQDRNGRTTRIEMSRFAALRHAHRAFMRYIVTPLNHDAPVRIQTGIDGSICSNVTGERQFEISAAEASDTGRCLLTARTRARRHEVRIGVLSSFLAPPPAASVRAIVEHNRVYTEFTCCPAAGRPIAFDRHIALTSTEDDRHGVVAACDDELEAARAIGFDAALEQQATAWRDMWERADVQIEGDDRAQRYLRFCLYHVLAAAPRHTDRQSVPVKLLTGDHYQGTMFYDTDLYIEPVYLFTFPELTRTCLNYRFHGLDPGHEIARTLGYHGAKFAWQAGPYGEECLGRWWRFTHNNIHVNADVAYSLMLYYWATGDETYMRQRGVDLLVETARFYADRAAYDANHDAYHLRDVAGPDEGHCECNDNFYTNYLAKRSLDWAGEMLAHLQRTSPEAHAAALRRLDLRPDEPPQWRRVADRLTLLFDPATTIYEQCEGFYRLKPLPPHLLDDRKTWFVTVFPYQALNQPDVVMALALFRGDFDEALRRANWEYYKDKSMNFSSVSFAINAMMAADLGDLDSAYRNFLICAGGDLDESLTGRGDTRDGLHGTACGGAWLAAVFGFGGVHLSRDGLRIDPHLPPAWSALRFNLAYRGAVLRVAINRQELEVAASGPPGTQLPLRVCGHDVTLATGQAFRTNCTCEGRA